MTRLVAILALLGLSLSPAQGQYKFYLYEKTDKAGVAPWLRYNKADGAFLGFSGYYRPFGSFTLSGRSGYGFASKDARYDVAAQQTWISGNHEFTLSAGHADLTFTNDSLVIPDWQNSMTALLVRQDYHNYYRTRGTRIRFGADLDGTYRLYLAGGMQKYTSLANRTRYSVFDWKAVTVDGKKSFAPNPAVAEGNDYYLQLGYEIDYRPSPMAFVSAWYFQGSYTNSRLFHRWLKSDFSYHKLNLVFRRYQQLFARNKLAVSLRVASHQGRTSTDTSNVPADQFLFDLGGYGSLRGYGYREFSDGNRLVLASADYLFNGSFLPKTFLARIWGLKMIFRSFDLLVFADAGRVWTTDDSKSFLSLAGMKPARFAVDAGVGLAMSDWIRFECAFPLKQSAGTRAGHPTVYLRLATRL